MDFVDFCRAQGVLIDYLPPIGKWVRLKTEDKSAKRNGAVKFMGDHGFVQNWATMTQPALWRGEATSQVIQKYQRQAAQRREQDNTQAIKAAATAHQMLSDSELLPHPYLEAKGFPDAVGSVLGDELLVPMYNGGLVGLQRIKPDGKKLFLFGQRSGGASFTIGQGRLDFWCEGYATALSLQEVLRSLKMSYRIHVCFSAGNMQKLAKNGFVIADNDASQTGQRVAIATGLPHWISDQKGEDFNDAWLRLGTFKLAMQIRRLTNKIR